MQNRIILPQGGFRIRPCDIHMGEGFRGFFGAFDQMETEASALHIVALCQAAGDWVPFSDEQIEAQYNKAGHRGYRFNRLVNPGKRVLNGAEVFAGGVPITEPAGGGWIVKGEDGLYRVTEDFVIRCFRSSPARSEPVLQPA